MTARSDSALEQELRRLFGRLRANLVGHDRGVLFGFLLCLVPVPPVALIGIAISAFNYKLWKDHKLDLGEGPAIKRALGIGLIVLGLSSAFWYYIIFATLDELPAALRLLREALEGLREDTRSILYWLLRVPGVHKIST